MCQDWRCLPCAWTRPQTPHEHLPLLPSNGPIAQLVTTPVSSRAHFSGGPAFDPAACDLFFSVPPPSLLLFQSLERNLSAAPRRVPSLFVRVHPHAATTQDVNSGFGLLAEMTAAPPSAQQIAHRSVASCPHYDPKFGLSA
jgi:hypothetical protein